MKPESSAMLFFIVFGIIFGYASFLLKDNLYAAIAALVGFFLGAFVLKFAIMELKEKGYKWYFSNGGWIYFFIWFIVWVVFYNL